MTAVWWTDERIAQLRKFYADGVGPSAAARLMGAASRNMVIGKAHRLGLVLNRSVRAPSVPMPAITREQGAHAQSQAQPRPIGVVEQASVPPIATRSDAFVAPPRKLVALLDLRTGQCRWPFGEAPVLFCGLTTAVPENLKCPYCRAHLDLARGSGTMSERSAVRDGTRAASFGTRQASAGATP